ncbi:hypothetical protein [Actinomadura sp. CNU-125]|uniref:hypothetical protein n=1 Tax=Actinomadura sp. CNU-125 TaxID=1904961 RepID=UPI0021CCDD9D|nr:hypothetical protein [Actinomadura sp. CNU-125]
MTGRPATRTIDEVLDAARARLRRLDPAAAHEECGAARCWSTSGPRRSGPRRGTCPVRW